MKLTIKGPEGYEAKITENGQYTIGRKGCLVKLYDLQERTEPQNIAASPDVSRSHLGITIDSHINLTDLESTFGSYLNGRKFKKESFSLPGERILTLGETEFLLTYEP